MTQAQCPPINKLSILTQEQGKVGVIFNVGTDDITIDEPQPFRAGVNRAGDTLYAPEIIWVWRVNVKNSDTVVYHFRAGASAAGERLTSFSNQTIESLFNDLKPAHTFCYFTYEENA